MIISFFVRSQLLLRHGKVNKHDQMPPRTIPKTHVKEGGWKWVDSSGIGLLIWQAVHHQFLARQKSDLHNRSPLASSRTSWLRDLLQDLLLAILMPTNSEFTKLGDVFFQDLFFLIGKKNKKNKRQLSKASSWWCFFRFWRSRSQRPSWRSHRLCKPLLSRPLRQRTGVSTAAGCGLRGLRVFLL